MYIHGLKGTERNWNRNSMSQKYVSFLHRGPIDQFFTTYEKVNAISSS
ncbi:hypothetical protein [Paenibacillus contaminans]|nr:hypothetical protein [Paenibacillus contaminans]